MAGGAGQRARIPQAVFKEQRPDVLLEGRAAQRALDIGKGEPGGLGIAGGYPGPDQVHSRHLALIKAGGRPGVVGDGQGGGNQSGDRRPHHDRLRLPAGQGKTAAGDVQKTDPYHQHEHEGAQHTVHELAEIIHKQAGPIVWSASACAGN